MEKFGVDNLETAIVFLAVGGSAMDDALADGKFQFKEDSMKMLPTIMAIPGFANALPHIGKEFKDLSEPEQARIHNTVKERLNLRNDKVEAVVEEAINIGMSFGRLINNIRAAKQTEA